MPPPSSGLFVDPEFLPCETSLVQRGDTPLSPLCERIRWQRPQEISARPQLFPSNGRQAVGSQGILGDCWFICACSALQKCPRLLQQVFPAGQCTWDDPGYSGRFTCRFWRFGHWVEVTIDDCLPCLGHKLCFSHCHDQTIFWLPLLEKAYAKLHGSYDALWAGQVVDALVDLTGGLVERWILEYTEESIKEKMLCRMFHLRDHCAISCSVLRSKEGTLGEFHAFTVTDIQCVVTKYGQELMLLRVHNPWGRSCWSGAWGKNNDKWALIAEPDSAHFLDNLQDGEFWAEKEEFLQNFNEVTMAFPVDEMANMRSIWTDCPLLHTQQIFGSWIKGQTAGGSRNNVSFPDNPKFWLRVKEQSEAYLALMQRPRVEGSAIHRSQSRRLISNSTALCAIGLHIWKVEKHNFNLQKTIQSPIVGGTSSHSYDRQLHLRFDLSPGYYLVIPSTFLRDTEGDFLLRVLSSGLLALSEITSRRPAVMENEYELEGTWETRERKGQWRKGVNSGGSRNFASYLLNPTIPFSVPSKAQMVRVTLQQHFQGKHCHAIGFHVYMVPSDSSKSPVDAQEPCASCVPHSHSYEVSMVCHLSPGQYIIVPSTYFPDQECEFSVLISTKTERKSVQSKETLGNFLKEVSNIAVRK